MKTFSVIILTASLAFVVPQSIANDDDAILIKLDESLNDYWVVEKKVAPGYPRGAIRSRQQGCATVGYVIESDGSTSGHWVIASHPKKVFDRSAIKANMQFAYSPGALNPSSEPVVTINTFTYQLAKDGQEPGKAKREAISRLCKDAAIEALEANYGPLS